MSSDMEQKMQEQIEGSLYQEDIDGLLWRIHKLQFACAALVFALSVNAVVLLLS